jgi:lipoprotein-anchoring transpeptidase ErfK/SrfK
MNMRDMNEGSGRRDAGGNTEKLSRQELDVPDKMSRQERDVPNRLVGKDAAGSRFTDRDATDRDVPEVTKKSDADARAAYAKLKAAGSNSKTPAAALQTVSRSVAAAPAAAAAAPAAAQAQPIYDNDAPVVSQKPDATRVNAYNSDIMYAPTIKSDPNVEHDAEMNRLARTRATRQGAVVAQSPNAQAQARILRQAPTPVQSATNAQAQARLLRQGTPSAQAAPPAPTAQQSRYTKDKYGNIIDNTTGKVSRTIFSAGQEGNAARVGMKRGGTVKKMASGGMASSKMSKPSGASRGDGIAQRGKTRGTLR